MSFLDWTDQLDIGVKDMNEEHKVLISKMNLLHKLHDEKEGVEKIGTALKDLYNYTVKHFSNEEVYLESIGYPELNTHKRIHKKLLDDLGDFAHRLEQTKELEERFFTFLKTWLRAHIIGIDKKYGDYSMSKPA